MTNSSVHFAKAAAV